MHTRLWYIKCYWHALFHRRQLHRAETWLLLTNDHYLWLSGQRRLMLEMRWQVLFDVLLSCLYKHHNMQYIPLLILPTQAIVFELCYFYAHMEVSIIPRVASSPLLIKNIVSFWFSWMCRMQFVASLLRRMLQ